MASQPNLNIYGDTIITITNKIMRIFLSKKYSSYMQNTDLETIKLATNQFLTLYFITLQKQNNTIEFVQSIIRNTTCENILNIWFHRNTLNHSIITENGDELMYNILGISGNKRA